MSICAFSGSLGLTALMTFSTVPRSFFLFFLIIDFLLVAKLTEDL
jgi:hypothetical protein